MGSFLLSTSSTRFQVTGLPGFFIIGESIGKLIVLWGAIGRLLLPTFGEAMTLCVAVTTAGGLVLGADSMTVVRDGPASKTYANAVKIFEIPGLPIGILTYGLGSLGRRSIGSLIDEWTLQPPPFAKDGYTVQQIAENVGTFVFERHRLYRDKMRAILEEAQKRALESGAPESAPLFNELDYTTGLVVGGFQPESMFPWLWAWEEPSRPGVPQGLTQVRPHEGEKGENGPVSGLDYWGETRSLDRLVRGCDPDIENLVRGSGADPAPDLSEHEWSVLYEGMPLKDAADLAQFALEVGSGYHRFTQDVPQVGGELDIAIITRRGTHWHARKELTRRLNSGSMMRFAEESKG